MHDPTITMTASELEKMRREHNHELRNMEYQLEAQSEMISSLREAMSETGDERRMSVLLAAVEYANAEWASSHYCAPIQGLEQKKGTLLFAVKSLIAVESGRGLEYGHLSYCVSAWKKEMDL